MKRTASPSAYTAAKFSQLTGHDRHTLTKTLEELNAKPSGQSSQGANLYRLKDLVNAAAGGDQRAENLRKTRAESERLELQNMRTKGELVEVAAVKRLGQNVMAAVRNRILNMPLTDDEKDQCLRELLELKNTDWNRC